MSGWTQQALMDRLEAGRVRGVRVWSPAPEDGVLDAATAAADWQVTHVHQRRADKSGIIAACAAAFPLPSYLGHNWDALEEALGDHVCSGAGMVAVWHGWADFAVADPGGFAVMLDIWRSAARAWAQQVPGAAVTLIKPSPMTTVQGAAIAMLPRIRPE